MQTTLVLVLNNGKWLPIEHNSLIYFIEDSFTIVSKFLGSYGERGIDFLNRLVSVYNSNSGTVRSLIKASTTLRANSLVFYLKGSKQCYILSSNSVKEVKLVKEQKCQ